jgi:3-hydroxyacyl-[acyl-carrier-protein] dehydratase
MPSENPPVVIPVLSFLKQRFPFLMVDRVLSWEKDHEIRAIKNITVNEPFFSGHFPDYPIFPGALTIEAFAQAAALLITLSEGPTPEDLFDVIGTVMDFRFLKPLFPGDILEIHMVQTKVAGMNRIVEGKGTVNGEPAASGKFLFGKIKKP